MNQFNYKKAVQMINFFCIKGGNSINKLKLMKLIWLADRVHLRKYSRLISEDKYYAMEQGPVASSILDLIESNGITFTNEQIKYSSKYFTKTSNITINSIAPVETKLFSKSDINVMEEVYEFFHKFNPKDLSEFSHKFPEWFKHETELNKGVKRKEIDIRDFFENISESVDFPSMNLDKEHLELSKEFYLESHPTR